MNFKTTIVLLVLVAAVAAYLFVTSGNPASPTASTEAAATARKVFDVDPANVTAVTVTPADGQPLALEKAGTDWRMTSPVKAVAEKWAVDDLVRAVAELQSRGQVDAAAAPGVAGPRYKVSLVAAGKTYDLAVGDRSAVGDNLY
ncbi:MAG TPA: DUF4340 domain-containing protein, partial [Tepidisphaeraceae bacterium]|nr:DUF4340 domain-containing protein [Tepidisphaeraceae bacterium]